MNSLTKYDYIWIVIKEKKYKIYPIKVLNDLSYKIIGCAYKVHKKLGPGLLESTYEICLQNELIKADLKTVSQLSLPITYDTIKFDAG